MIHQSTFSTHSSALKRLAYSSAIILVALAFSLIYSASTFAVQGSIGGRPANPTDTNKRTRSIFVHTIDFGKSVEEGVLIVNNSDSKQTANVYAVDATITSSGSLTCKQRVEDKKDVGSWIDVAQSTITLNPRSEKIIPFTISVPNKKVDVGEHNGCIVIEPVVDEADGNSGGLRIRTRSAIRVAVTIPGDLKKKLDFTKFDVRYDKGNYYYDVSVKNSGNVSLDADIRVKLTTLSGDVVFNNGGEYPVIPGARLDLNFIDEHPPLFGGFYWAEASTSYDGSLTNEIGIKTNAQLVKQDRGRQLVFVAPTMNGMIIILGVLGLVTGIPYYFMRRRAERSRMLQSGKYHVVNPGENLRSVAEHYNTTWKKLASLNSIKPPYDVKLGTVLVVPQKASKEGKAKTSKKV